MLSRDYFFEFAGMPQSGKSVVAENVAHYFRSSGIPVGEYRGGSRFSPLRDAPIEVLNLLLACRATEFIITHVHEKRDHKIYLLDRGIIDRCIFTNTLSHRRPKDAEQGQRITNFLTSPMLLNTLDGVFIFITSPEMALEREHRSKLELSMRKVNSPREVMNYSFLSEMQSETKKMYENMKELISNVQLYDTADNDGKIGEIAIDIINDIEGRTTSNVSRG